MTTRRWWTASAVLALAGAGLMVSGTSGAAGPPRPGSAGGRLAPPVAYPEPPGMAEAAGSPLADPPTSTAGSAAGARESGSAGGVRSPGSAGDARSPGGAGGAKAAGSAAGMLGPAPTRPWVPPLPPSRPVWLEVPAIGLRTPLASLGLTAGGLIDVPEPTKGSPAGWYRYSRTPGERGAAVIVGHVDSAHDGPAVFYRLGELVPGDRIGVGRADGSTAVFTVQRSVVVPKDRFPAQAVYGPTERPVLRLITCGGSFDHLRGHYRGNLVVFAVLAGTVPHY